MDFEFSWMTNYVALFALRVCSSLCLLLCICVVPAPAGVAIPRLQRLIRMPNQTHRLPAHRNSSAA
ncbi:hypothetical protein F4827_000811 [Paraburkholderia bannensis]|jgi:hypothetical protein|uniref:Uncharacterized protein n=1 Tax=Paraburkholderia bannensis TaxID=765414 RepID=A0A7W9TV84_9BURK|nr:hypothetical protein [Paraburkholderia sp. WP4_3_2]MBB6100985.1 hypothetical protein [Paraburkholderia bannensis]